MKLTNENKIVTGIVLLLLCLVCITLGCGVTWGVTGSLIGAGLLLLVYAIICFGSVKE